MLSYQIKTLYLETPIENTTLLKFIVLRLILHRQRQKSRAEFKETFSFSRDQNVRNHVYTLKLMCVLYSDYRRQNKKNLFSSLRMVNAYYIKFGRMSMV